MTVGNRQKFLSDSVQPSITGRGLALGAMPIAAGVKLNILVKTAITLLEARTESGGATGADVSEYFALRSGQCVPPAGKELLGVLTKDIGYFQPMLRHERGL
jgi:hypothetical protein